MRCSTLTPGLLVVDEAYAQFAELVGTDPCR